MNSKQNKTTLLSLPLDIRLQIYRWLHLISPLRQLPLAPGCPTPIHCQYILRRVGHDADFPPDYDTSPGTASLLSSYRPLSILPTSLLQTNSQIYHEARLIPFTYNEFVFVNWFASGLWAARAFTRALAPWQRSALRFVRLEVLARDVLDGAGREEWRALCKDWAAGVRGLRMKMVLGSNTVSTIPTTSGTSDLGSGGVGPRAEETRRWVGEGLEIMEGVERVEMEVVAREMVDEDKVRWCEMLEEELRGKGLEKVKVVCVEEVQEKVELTKGNVWWKALVINWGQNGTG
ncbi:hypothetical protein BGZ61DRAFT_500388 [Ilyonectria robusta]|uniref:uncharacterized protein n=1 Tax=Ilyonectria robusta TaxID=1079257 RepID=UPI001E8DC9AD|nr:uncharacterized protein BGZ61DRAFT_500388 [Ilyonectria robusta]KAH8654901.1 hypothetical protein BGZ61DRAFT_500388 [Ilyonectria robusta]